MIRQVFLRCNGGDYFTTEHCPFDGWTTKGFKDVLREASRLGDAVSHAELERMGVADDVLERVVIMEFRSEDSAFEGLYLAHVLADGKDFPLHLAPERLK